MLNKLKKLIALDNPFRLLYHKIKAILANLYYNFPSKNMVIIWVTWTNWKTTTCNIIAKWLRATWKKVFMFSTVNIIIWDEEYTNETKMTSPDSIELQKLLSIAKKEGCEIAVIETASHWIKMNRIWWLEYDICVLTNITQDHLDLHRTMEDYVNTKLKIFKNLITYKRKKNIKKVAVVNIDSDYSDLFIEETYDSLYTYWNDHKSNLKATDIKNTLDSTKFKVNIPWKELEIKTKLKWNFNIHNILAAIWVFISLWIEKNKISEIIKEVEAVPWRMEEVENEYWYKVFVDYAHTPDALEKVLETVKQISWINNIISVFWATGDRDKTKRPIMWQIVSEYSNKVILTQDDDYTEPTENIIKDVLPWINRVEWKDFWIIAERKEAIRTGLLMAEPKDIVLIFWKWDEHILVTNNWPIEWHDKTIVKEIFKGIDDNKIIK